MKIIICGSLSAIDEIISCKKILEKSGHVVEIPEGVKRKDLRPTDITTSSEKADTKIQHDLIRGYFEKIKNHDVVLVVNPEKKGVKGYIGGNTLIEMAFTHVLNKKLYCLYPLPELPYTAEILATQPIVLNGRLDMFFK